MRVWLTALRKLQLAQKVRFALGVISAALLALTAAIDHRGVPSEGHPYGTGGSSLIQEFWRERYHMYTLTFSVLFSLAAWAFLMTNSAIRRRLVQDSTTTIGLSGVVDPLLGISFVLNGLMAGESGLIALKSRKRDYYGPPLKWTRPLIRRDWYESWVSEPCVAPIGRDCREAAELTRECIRELSGTVREWSHLFENSDLGLQALLAMQTMRVELQLLQQMLESPASADDEGSQLIASGLYSLRNRSAWLAVNFEYASGVPEPRQGVRCLAGALNGILDSSGLPQAQLIWRTATLQSIQMRHRRPGTPPPPPRCRINATREAEKRIRSYFKVYGPLA